MNMLMKSRTRRSPGRSMCGLPFAEVVLLWILMNISTSEGSLQEKYTGCFYDESQATVSAIVSFPKDDALTLDKCIAKCQTLNTTYAALQNGNICRCRNDYGVQLGLPDSTCYLRCSGNKNQICGGFMGQHNIAYSLYAVCPIGTYGSACDKGCHCKRDIPCDRMTGNCPDGCHGTWSGPACDITTVSHQYVGCYVDAERRALEFCINCEYRGFNSITNTIPSCIKSCAEYRYSYAGVQHGYACFCGESYGRYGWSTACTTRCSGDRYTICGGVWANSVYSVCPIGNYGKSCAGRCHCNYGGRCSYQDGSCWPSRCEPGWTGYSCNIRDCSRNNGGCFINETCTAINLTYSTVSVCICPNGFQRPSLPSNCTDTDECSLNVCDPDSMTCTNTIGSFNCSCRSGFQAHNTTTCIDIDECSLKVCDADTTICTNTIGSYNCSCISGFQPQNDTTCNDTDECEMKVCDPESMICTNMIGSYNCSCRRGYQALNDTVTACIDTDECEMKVCDPESMICTNTVGSYNCSCRRGFHVDNATTCIDTDECNLKVCDPDSMICTNTIGSYNCSCRSGFQTLNDTVTACMGERTITAGLIGSITGVALALAIAFALIRICIRRKYLDRAVSENRSSDEAERYVPSPCSTVGEDSSRTESTTKGTASDKGKSADNGTIRGNVCRPTTDEAAFNAASDINTYENVNDDASGFDETEIYTELDTYE